MHYVHSIAPLQMLQSSIRFAVGDLIFGLTIK